MFKYIAEILAQFSTPQKAIVKNDIKNIISEIEEMKKN